MSFKLLLLLLLFDIIDICVVTLHNKGSLHWLIESTFIRSSMISKEDYQVITFLDSADDKQKAVFLQENSAQCAKTFYHLLGHISKDQTLQYVLVMINDLLQASFSKFYTPSLCNHEVF